MTLLYLILCVSNLTIFNFQNILICQEKNYNLLLNNSVFQWYLLVLSKAVGRYINKLKLVIVDPFKTGSMAWQT